MIICKRLVHPDDEIVADGTGRTGSKPLEEVLADLKKHVVIAHMGTNEAGSRDCTEIKKAA